MTADNIMIILATLTVAETVAATVTEKVITVTFQPAGCKKSVFRYACEARKQHFSVRDEASLTNRSLNFDGGLEKCFLSREGGLEKIAESFFRASLKMAQLPRCHGKFLWHFRSGPRSFPCL